MRFKEDGNSLFNKNIALAKDGKVAISENNNELQLGLQMIKDIAESGFTKGDIIAFDEMLNKLTEYKNYSILLKKFKNALSKHKIDTATNGPIR